MDAIPNAIFDMARPSSSHVALSLGRKLGGTVMNVD
jgi:hypothetical protein